MAEKGKSQRYFELDDPEMRLASIQDPWQRSEQGSSSHHGVSTSFSYPPSYDVVWQDAFPPLKSNAVVGSSSKKANSNSRKRQEATLETHQTPIKYESYARRPEKSKDTHDHTSLEALERAMLKMSDDTFNALELMTGLLRQVLEETDILRFKLETWYTAESCRGHDSRLQTVEKAIKHVQRGVKTLWEKQIATENGAPIRTPARATDLSMAVEATLESGIPTFKHTTLGPQQALTRHPLGDVTIRQYKNTTLGSQHAISGVESQYNPFKNKAQGSQHAIPQGSQTLRTQADHPPKTSYPSFFQTPTPQVYDASFRLSNSGQDAWSFASPPSLPLPMSKPQGVVSSVSYNPSYHIGQPFPSVLTSDLGAFQNVEPLPVADARAGSPLPPKKALVEDVVEKAADMGFSRDQARAVVGKLFENGQPAELNVVLDKLVKNPEALPKKGWFGW